MNLSLLISLVFTAYELLILVRILASWFPQLQAEPLMEQIAKVTDPYLQIYQRLLPPLWGVLDLSPAIALMVLHWLRRKCLMLLALKIGL